MTTYPPKMPFSEFGRRATFTALYAQWVYAWEMLGYVIGLFLNIIAYIKAKSQMINSIIRDQMKRTRIYLALGLLSTVLVSMTDVKSLLYTYPDLVSTPISSSQFWMINN
ncbi:hypothetical protein KIN20_006160 [Parelaphostrongylus tenuis]|uniref:Uncharacterized protein n=1 Tax=Parelaphostrongylus tenuis TaxID=148309 RepID=A0AAD5QJ54_PARTN|nr:hypothetical protein KIN20_006160 [Parelaphostrongylus tenuis]